MVADLSGHAEKTVARVLGRMSLFISGPAGWADAVFHQDFWHCVPTRFVIDHVRRRMVAFVNGFLGKSRRNRDGQ